MAGHGSPPDPDRANHPARKVGREPDTVSVFRPSNAYRPGMNAAARGGTQPPRKRAQQVAEIERQRATPAFRYALSQRRKNRGS